MRASGAAESEAAAELVDIVNIINMADTGESQRAAIAGILNIKKRLEEAE
jgi:hypothetical protein